MRIAARVARDFPTGNRGVRTDLRRVQTTGEREVHKKVRRLASRCSMSHGRRGRHRPSTVVNAHSSWYPRGVSRLVPVIALTVACSHSPTIQPAPATPMASAPLAPPAAAVVPAAPPAAQRFSDGDLGYRFDDVDRKAKL